MRKSVIEAFCANGCGQVIYDCGGEFEREEDLHENEIVPVSILQLGNLK